MRDRLLLPPRSLVAFDPEEERPSFDVLPGVVRDPEEQPAPAQQAALPSSVRADLRRVHP